MVCRRRARSAAKSAKARGAKAKSAADDDDDNPHEAMAMQMMAGGGAEEGGEAPMAEHESIGSDIFDDSLRYSNVDRPTLKVDVSSPTRQEQRRGSFMDEDRIANFFRRK